MEFENKTTIRIAGCASSSLSHLVSPGSIVQTFLFFNETLKGLPSFRFLKFLRDQRYRASTTSVAIDALRPCIRRPSALEAPLLPTHLPQAPRSLQARLSRKAKGGPSEEWLAWRVTEALVGCFGFWELRSPKTVEAYRQSMGEYHVTPLQ